MATQDYVRRVVAEVAEALQPLAAALGSADNLTSLFGSLGWSFDDGAASSLTGSLQTAGTAVQKLAADAAVGADLGILVADVAAVGAALIASAPAATDTLPVPLNSAQFWQSLPDDVLELLLFDYLDQYHQLAFGLLAVVGVVHVDVIAADPVSGRASFQRKCVGIDRLASFVRNPAQALQTDFGWGGAFDHEAAIFALGALLRGMRADSVVSPAAGQLLDVYYDTLNAARGSVDQLVVSAPALSSGDGTAVAKAALVVLPVPPSADNTASPEGLVLRPTFFGQVSGAFPLGDVASLNISGTATDTPVEVYLRPSGVSAVVSAANVQAQLAVLLSLAPAMPLVIAGDAAGSRIELWKAHVSLSVTAAQTGLVLEAGAVFDQLRFVVDAAEGDGFVAEMLGSGPLQVDVGPGITWSSTTGLRFVGQSMLNLNIPLHVSLAGVIDLTMLSIGPQSSASDAVAVDIGLTGSLTLGPLIASVQNMGIAVQARGASAASPGNLGPVDLEFGFKPPDGVGLALDAPPVSGTGFLSYSATDGRYLGAFALTAGDVAISAVGVLDTKLPGGASGYSLLIVASATFPPIELGFGFSLSGIGGLAGVNRTANVPSLQALARAGRLDDLMFPADLIHRAPQVAANLAQQFPAAQGHFIVGPAAQIEWGTGGMIYADLGVFIELTDSGGGITVLRIALLGLVHMTLPAAAAPVADITLDVLGVLDFAAQTLSLDAGLRNSTIATFPLTGQAALRAGWGSNPEFLFAIGGFNPHFQAPAGFPALQRIALAIGGDNPRLRLSAYLAVTSNTLQLGCAADLYAAVSVAGVTAAVQASLTFDALVQFQPFGLIVDLTIAAAILVNNNPILSLSLALHVTGPQPWTVTGSASFQFLFISITVPISITAGPAAPPQSPQTVDLDGNLVAALSDPHSWATGPPAGRGLVHVRSQDAAQPAMHPLGTVTVRQHAVPLAQRIERYGPDLLDAPCLYTITSTALGGQAAASSPVTDFFAPAQFLTMTDAQKLSAPSFQTMTAGTALGTSALTVPASAGSVVDTQSTAAWDTLVLDSPDPATSGTSAQPGVVATSGSATVPDAVLANQLGGAPIALNGPAGRGQAPYAAPGSGIGVEQPTYAVVGMNLRAPGATAAITTLRIGSIAAGQVVAATVGDAQNTQVVYTSEVPS
jgi:hypothetical protein